MSSSWMSTAQMEALLDYWKSFEIRFLDLYRGTNYFDDENVFSTGSSKVYKATIEESGKLVNIVARQYLDEQIYYGQLFIYKLLKHKNIVPIYKIVYLGVGSYIINKYEAKGSLKKHLSGPALNWMRRLHICVGIAHALKYLHYDIEGDQCIIHGNVKSSKILLDDSWEPKLDDFRCALLAKKNILNLVGKYNGSLHYMDPEYAITGGLTRKSDVFSFGVVLFEVLFGREASIQTNDNLDFVRLARSHYEEKKMDDLIDPDLRKQMNQESLNIFAETAYYCIKERQSQRQNINQVLSKLEEARELQNKHENPTVGEGALSSNYLKVKNLDHLKFRLRDIELATNKFSDSFCIGFGGYGKVYKAQLNLHKTKLLEVEEKNNGKLPKERSTVAIKRIFRRIDHQGEQGFIAEIEMLSNVKHKNIVSLHGFCDEGEEMILVYEYISNGSLADYLENVGHKTNLTWAQRIQICIDVANGLKYLHTSTNDKESIIHRDIKSANILLDENWGAKIADFGLSKLHHSNQQGSTLVTNNIAGTEVYLDPEYLSTGKLKTKSDIYSFGVVMFEIMCGKLAYDRSYGQNGLPSITRQCFKEGTLKNLIDHKITEVNEDILIPNGWVNQDSLETFTKVAHQCLAKTQRERPTIEVIIKELEKSLNFQITNKNNPRIPLEAIRLGTQNFSCCNCIGEGKFWKLYKGEIEQTNGRIPIIAKRWDTKSNQGTIQFSRELYILSRYKHENIIGLVGYCNEGNEHIIVYENASNGTLSQHVGNPSLTWVKRLKICIDIASGLSFLHKGDEEHTETMLHRDIKSSSILLDGDWNVKISNFELSCKRMYGKDEDVDDNYRDLVACVDKGANKNWGYIAKRSDCYSIGVILIEMLCGRLAWVEGCEDDSQSFGHLAARHYHENGNLDGLILESIKEQIGPILSNKYVDVAIKCLERPHAIWPNAQWIRDRLEEILEFQNLYISLKSINLGTQNFSEESCIGEGKLRKYYGVVEHANECTSIVAKRWDKDSDEAHVFFLKELDLYFTYIVKDKPEDILGLVGYCNEENEKIIVYKHASRRLDKYLGDPSLTWKKRLKIGINVANGLDYFVRRRSYKGEVRSRDILLDDNWNAKISNLDSFIDPEYPYPCDKWGGRTIYSIGVILIEMLCGKVAWTEGCKDYSQSLDNIAISHYIAEKNIDDMIFEGIKEQIAPESLIRYQESTFECLRNDVVLPLQALVVAGELEKALELQEDYEEWEPKLPINYKDIIRWTNYNYRTKKDLYDQLSKGLLFQDGKVFFSIGSNGGRNEMISARKFSYKNPSLHKFRAVEGSRFSKVLKMFDSSNLNIHVKIRTLFLCPSVKYKVHLIFKFCGSRKSKAKPMYVNLKYKIGKENMCAYFATWREDGWMMVELFQFLCHKKDTDFEVLLESFSRSYCGRHAIYIEGIQFQEVRNVKHEEIEMINEEYQEIIETESKTNKRKDDIMLHASEVVCFFSESAIQSRFERAIELLGEQVFYIKCKIKSEILSSNKENVCYLVFKLSDEHFGLHGPVVVRDQFHWRNKETRVFYFKDQKPWNLHDTDSVPKKREDGWMEVIVWKYNSNYELKNDHLFVNLKFVTYEGTMAGLIVRNIEFR